MIAEARILSSSDGVYSAVLTYSVGAGNGRADYFVESYKTEAAGSRNVLVERLRKVCKNVIAREDNRSRWYINFDRTYFWFPNFQTAPQYFPTEALAKESVVNFKQSCEKAIRTLQRQEVTK